MFVCDDCDNIIVSSLDNVEIICLSRTNKLFYFKYGNLSKTITCNYAAENNYLNLLKWCKEHGGIVNKEIFKLSFKNIEMTTYLYCPDYRYDNDIMNIAAKVGNLTVLEYLFEKGFETNEYLLVNGVKSYDINIIEYLLSKIDQNSPHMLILACTTAAKTGQFDVLKLLYNIPIVKDNYWNEKVNICCGAAKGNHLDILKWLRLNNCPWDYRVCHISVKNGNNDLCIWAIKNGCDHDPDYFQEHFKIKSKKYIAQFYQNNGTGNI
jgi:hypothetical protein